MTAADNMDELDEQLSELAAFCQRHDAERIELVVRAGGLVDIKICGRKGGSRTFFCDLSDATHLPSVAIERLKGEP